MVTVKTKILFQINVVFFAISIKSITSRCPPKIKQQMFLKDHITPKTGVMLNVNVKIY